MYVEPRQTTAGVNILTSQTRPCPRLGWGPEVASDSYFSGRRSAPPALGRWTGQAGPTRGSRKPKHVSSLSKGRKRSALLQRRMWSEKLRLVRGSQQLLQWLLSRVCDIRRRGPHAGTKRTRQTTCSQPTQHSHRIAHSASETSHS